MNADSPFEGDVPRDGDEPGYKWLDEWLCEYVDGTMDPSLEAVFEQYVEANPELKAHVQRLRQTRDLLCGCGLSSEPPPEVEEEVCREVEGDLHGSATEEDTAARDSIARIGLVPAVTAALVIGFLVGAVVVRPGSPAITLPGPSADPVAVETESAPSTQRPVQVPEQTVPDRLQRSFAAPLSTVDTTQSLSTITTIGTP